MAVNSTTTTTSTPTDSTSTTASTAEELQQKIQDAYAKIQSAAQEMGRSAYAQVKENVNNLYKEYAEALKNPTQPHDFENDRVQLEAMAKVLDNPIKDDAPDAAEKKKEKELADKEFREVTKKYSKSELQLAQDEKLKGKTDARVTAEHEERAKNIGKLFSNSLKADTQNNRGQTQNLTTQADAEKKQGLFAALIKAPKAPMADKDTLLAKKAETPLKDPKLPNEKAPAKAQSKPVAQSAQGEEVELAEAFEGDFEKPVELAVENGEVAAADAQNELEVVAGQEGPDGANSNPEESKQLVQVALATGVLQRSNLAAGLDPKRDITAVMRDVQSECNGLLGECGEMQNSAMIFVMQGAVRNAKVQGLKGLTEGKTRSGEPEATLAELQRVRNSVGRTAKGVAGQSTTRPAAVLENGEVSAVKSRDMLAVAEGRQSVGFATVDNDPVLRMRQAIGTWNSKDAADTAGFEGRKHSEILA